MSLMFTLRCSSSTWQARENLKRNRYQDFEILEVLWTNFFTALLFIELKPKLRFAIRISRFTVIRYCKYGFSTIYSRVILYISYYRWCFVTFDLSNNRSESTRTTNTRKVCRQPNIIFSTIIICFEFCLNL